jgi:dUTP pyrophosphatase
MIKVKKLHKDGKIAVKDTENAGYDLHTIDEVIVPIGGSAELRTGLAFELPNTHYLQIHGRSGLAFKKSVIVFNGVIDSGYRGEVKVKLFNLGKTFIKIEKGDRIAQAILLKCEHMELEFTDELAESKRGEDGFGSSGR